MIFGKKDYANLLQDKAASINASSERKMVFADCTDLVLQAASQVKKRRIATPIVLGDFAAVTASLKKIGVQNLTSENIIDAKLPANADLLNSLAAALVKIKKESKKGATEESAKELLSNPAYFACMMVSEGLAHAVVAGAVPETRPLKPGYELVGLAKGVSKTSGLVLLYKGSEKALLITDCSFSATPLADDLAEFAELAVPIAASLDWTPKVAFLSFSTKGSAKHLSSDKARMGAEIFKKHNPEVVSDGELQADCAVDALASSQKCNDSPLKGEANILVMPDLNSANISYKLLENLGGYSSIGPAFMGFSKPVNDIGKLSNAEDIVNMAALSIVQSKACEGFEKKGVSRNAGKKSEMKKYDKMELIPANVRKIIEAARNDKKPEKKED
jgi:phosphate acetyltransferase